MQDREFSNEEKAQAAAREARLRRGVYPRWITAGRMTADEAERGIRIMEQIERDYLARAGQGDLFSGGQT